MVRNPQKRIGNYYGSDSRAPFRVPIHQCTKSEFKGALSITVQIRFLKNMRGFILACKVCIPYTEGPKDLVIRCLGLG